MANKCGYQKIDERALLETIKEHIVKSLEESSQKLIEIMRREMQITTHGDAPGKPEWRELMAKDLRETYRTITDLYIEFGVGLPYEKSASSMYKLMRAMVVAYGSGSIAGGEPIQTKPGKRVWDSDLRDKKDSTARTSYLLPEEFNQVGNDFISNALKIMHVYFVDALEKIWSEVANAEITRCVQVVKRQ